MRLISLRDLLVIAKGSFEPAHVWPTIEVHEEGRCLAAVEDVYDVLDEFVQYLNLLRNDLS
jgi:hypothetical protein